MIARLSGALLEKLPDRVVIDVSGVGYSVAISFQTYQELPDAGNSAALLIHTHVREDMLALFGFASEREKKLFEMLISVSGVGPKLALTLLSGIPADDLLGALAKGDARRLVSIPGIGKKTAERLTLELKEKAEKLFVPPAGGPGVEARDVVSALVNFGYKKSEADRVVDHLTRKGAPPSFADFLKEALAALSGG
ncbi:MAG TPA: Holliday junction branch migration protein RuvA [Thermoanaerobaculia bacterium]|jgi:Holliday junction DNA helicase RuvA|nr:Holliday junction branch migration protein RuvA [Thermoanaerobaculia bacterium]